MIIGKLLFIDIDGNVEFIQMGELSCLLYPDGIIRKRIFGMQSDDLANEDVEEAIKDLSRIGARYHEFRGGTLVIALLD